MTADYLTTTEVAEMTRHSMKTLANWRWQGSGPRWVKVGGRVLYPVADFRAWLEGEAA